MSRKTVRVEYINEIKLIDIKDIVDNTNIYNGAQICFIIYLLHYFAFVQLCIRM